MHVSVARFVEFDSTVLWAFVGKMLRGPEYVDEFPQFIQSRRSHIKNNAAH